MRKQISKWKVGLAVTLATALVLLAIVPVFAQEELTYLTLEGTGFAGRVNMRFYEHDASKVDRDESIRYMVVYVLNQSDDEESLIMSGSWSGNTTVPNGALVMAWNSIYGPYTDKEAYDAKNCSECTVAPDYFWVAWGAQGDYSTGLWGRPTKPYLTLDGIGLGVDWDESAVLSFGEISLRGRMVLTRSGNETEARYYKPQVLIQMLQVESDTMAEPHWSSYQSRYKLYWEEDGADCWDNLLGDFSFICDWIYDHFGLDICPELEQ